MTYRSGHTVRTLCEVVALDARYPDIGLTPVTVVTDAGKAAMYLADDRELGTMTRALADDSLRVALRTDLLITDLEASTLADPPASGGHDVTPYQ